MACGHAILQETTGVRCSGDSGAVPVSFKRKKMKVMVMQMIIKMQTTTIPNGEVI